MGIMTELLESAKEICEICGGYKDMPLHCEQCKRYVTIGGEKVLIKPKTLEVLAMGETGKQ